MVARRKKVAYCLSIEIYFRSEINRHPLPALCHSHACPGLLKDRPGEVGIHSMDPRLKHSGMTCLLKINRHPQCNSVFIIILPGHRGIPAGKSIPDVGFHIAADFIIKTKIDTLEILFCPA